ncbi:MAG: DUF4931 domain-containing protein [Candidatus Omnitrophota bacterium]
MPELRKDPIIGRWVIISTERAKRPDNFTAPFEAEPQESCVFCEGHESETPAEIYAQRAKSKQKNTHGWTTRVVPSISPILRIEGELGKRGRGMYDRMNGIGAHEILIETPKHIANIASLEVEQITLGLDACVARIVDLEKDERFKYVLFFKNYGVSAGGSTMRHSFSQLIALPVNPKRVKEELSGARRYYDYRERCIFCDLIRQELEQDKRVVVSSDGFIALAPFASRFPFEVWIMPVEHSSDFYKIKDTKGLAKVLKITLQKLTRALVDPPYNYILHTAPFRRMTGAGYWRTVEYDYHWHIEIMPRLTRVAGFEWGSGFYINPVPPEEAVAYLKGVEV